MPIITEIQSEDKIFKRPTGNIPQKPAIVELAEKTPEPKLDEVKNIELPEIQLERKVPPPSTNEYLNYKDPVVEYKKPEKKIKTSQFFKDKYIIQ